MSKITSLLSAVAFLILGSATFAQIRGGVVDANGFPEEDILITVKGTSKTAYTDSSGNFDIDAKIGDVLVINGKEFVVTSISLGMLKLQQDITFEEVVVLGYSRTSTKAKSNEAVVTVSSEALANRPNISFLSSLQGNAPGIRINSGSGSPGSGKFNVNIRGLSSISSSTDPLYVIDGLATSGSQFRNLNTEDIEMISVLKDAQATSIYGNRGANGVVVITTKSAKFNTGLQIDYSALTTFSQFPKSDYNLANSKELLQIQKEMGSGLGATLSQQEINNFSTNTNWDDEFFRKGSTQQHNVGIRFGNENLSMYSSLGYLDNSGIIKATDFKRFTLRNNLVGRSKNDRFTYNSQIALGYSKRNQLDEETNTGISNNVVQNPLFGYLLSPSTLQPYPFINGKDMYDNIKSNTAGRSAWILQDIIRGGVRNQFTETSILANISGTYKLTDFLSIGNKSGIDFKESDRMFARDPSGYLAVVVAASQDAEFGGSETMNNIKDFTFSSVTNISFNHSFGDHSLNLTGYLDYIKAHYRSKQQTQNGLNPLNWSFGAGTGYIPFNSSSPNLYVPSISGSKIDAGTLAYFSVLEYDYASRFGFSGTIRRDGSYRFNKENRWETFWSVAGRWNIDREEFLRGSSVKMLKLRASYGTQGNQNLLVPANNTNPLFTGSNLYKNLNRSLAGYLGAPGYGLSILANDGLQWERVSQLNIGTDFTLFNDFLNGSVDVYQKKTDRLFNDIQLSAVTGQEVVKGNNGEIENKGIESFLKFNLIKKADFNFSVFVNGAYNKNKVLAMDEGENLEGDNVHAIGGPAFQWHLVRYVGVNSENGEQLFLDANGQITEEPTDKDRILTGKSALPKFTGGFGFNLDYKGFFADVLFSFQQGSWAYDNIYSWLMDPATGASYNVSGNLMNAWTQDNRYTDVPSLKANNSGLEGSSDRFLYRTDFVKLKNITVGYALSKDQLKNLPIKGLRIFLQGENLYTWTDWRGFDPEPIRSYSLGIYPNPQSVSLGLNLQF